MRDEELVKLANDAFDLQSWIDLSDSGGVEGDREVVDIQVCGDCKVIIRWHYPETCRPYLDVRYHRTDYQQIHESVYTYDHERRELRLNGNELFSEQVLSDPDMLKEIIGFYRDHAVELRNPISAEKISDNNRILRNINDGPINTLPFV